MSCDLYFFAGENSGDLHGEKLIQELKRQFPNLIIAGVGGPRMRAAGLQCTTPMEEFQVMGFIDVFFALPKLIRHFYRIVKEILKMQPKAVVTIDYPGWNLRLAKHLKKRGYNGKCIHFICPSVWAWGKKRIPLMEKTLDLLLTILPFEKELFKENTLDVRYVGHPLVERIKSHAYRDLALPAGKKIVAIFPGSRRKEIERNLPLYLEVCTSLHNSDPQIHFALSLSDEKYKPLILEILSKKENLPITFVDGTYSYELMRAAYLAIAKSGTVTLELALHRTPTVVTYAISYLDVIIARDILKIRLPFYCLVNIIAQKKVFTELFGPNFTAESLEREVKALLEEKQRREVVKECDALIASLGNASTSAEAAKAIALCSQLSK